MARQKTIIPLKKFAPIFEKLEFNEKEKDLVNPFFTNLNRNTFAVSFLPPEVIGALCSRTSRAREDLRIIFLKEFMVPFIGGKDQYGVSLRKLIAFLKKNPIEVIFSNPKGREFYIKWLAQYGDDSIAQMAGTHLIYSSVSQLVIKHFEDMRMGLAPIEKSTRYVDYSKKVGGQYRYYTDPTLEKMGLAKEYKKAMDGLFDAYTKIVTDYIAKLKEMYPEENELVLKAKAFDTARGLLPLSTLSQVAFFGNGQGFEYMLARSLEHPLGEIRWAADEAKEELTKIIPAFLRRADSDAASGYRSYLTSKLDGVEELLKIRPIKTKRKDVELVDFEKNGEEKVIAQMLYPKVNASYEEIEESIKKLSPRQKEKILSHVMDKRTARWYKAPRAFEAAYVTFDIVTNIGAWRDLHRHRLQSQLRQLFTTELGYKIPEDLVGTEFEKIYRDAIVGAEKVFAKIQKKNPVLAQYAVCMAHRVRFLQKQNLRAFFWETELRTTPQGHPDYRKIEQEKAKLVQKAYPTISKFLKVDFNDYSFARRGTAEKIKAKEAALLAQIKKRS